MIRLRNKYITRKWIGLTLAFIMLVTSLIPPGLLQRTEAAGAPHVVFSQVYVAGGNSGAIYNTKFFELYNPTDKDVDLSGWSLQYAAKNSIFPAKPGASNNKTLSGTIKAHGYYLITGGSGTIGIPLPVSADDTSSVNPGQAGGKLALVNKQDTISGKDDPNVVDFFTWSDSNSNLPNEYWGSPIIAPSPDCDEEHIGVEAFKKGTLLRKTNEGTDPRGVTGLGNGWFTKNTGADFVIHTIADPDNSIYIRHSGSAPEPALITPAPNTGLIRLENNYSTVTQSVYAAVYGQSEAVPRDSLVKVYVMDGGLYSEAASGQAESDGSFAVSFDNPSEKKTAYLSATLAGREESRIVRVDADGHDPSDRMIPLSDLRVNGSSGIPINQGSRVTVEGIVTVDNQLFGEGNSNFFIEDGTGGVKVLDGIAHGLDIKRGDRLRITGMVDFADGMTLLVPQSVTSIKQESLPEPVALTIADLNRYAAAEPHEGQLATIRGTVSQLSPSASDTNVTITDENGQAMNIKLFHGTGIDAVRKLSLQQSYWFTGIVGQHKTYAPFDSGYELYPREEADITGSLQLEHTPVTEGYTGLDLQFAATSLHAESVILYYRQAGSSDYAALPMTIKDGSHYEAVIHAADIPGAVLEYYITAIAGTQTQQAGSQDAPIKLMLVEDQEGPEFSEELPADHSQTGNRRPEISVNIFDPSGIDVGSVQAQLNGEPIAPAFDAPAGRVVIKLNSDLKTGSYKIEVTAKDTKGNAGKHTWTFRVLPTFEGGNHYRGSSHNHTGISHDAKGTPEQAIAAAKKHRYDWFAFTDHSHDIDVSSREAKDSIDRQGMPERTGSSDQAASAWQQLKQVSDDSTKDEEFVAFRSYEMTSTVWGHSNIFGTENFIDRIQNNGIYQNLNQFYKWAKTYDDLIGQFNHPNWGGSTPPFNAFVPYDQDVDKLFTMFEVGNGSGQYTYSNIENLYYKTLDLGWHVAPTFGEDHHNGMWGETMRRTVVVAEQLTRESLLDSMRNRRVYMSENPNFTLDVKANGYYMGSIVDSQSLAFSIAGRTSAQPYTYLPPGFTPDERIKTVELITNGGHVADFITPETQPDLFTDENKRFSWNPEVAVPGGQQWFLVKVTQMDGNRVYASPIWTKEVKVDVRVQDIQASEGNIIAGNPAVLEALISNFGQGELERLQVQFYADEVEESHLIGTAEVASLSPKSVSRVQVTWSNPTGGDRNIIAVIANPPVGNAQENNRFTRTFHVKEPLDLTVMIDAAHGNENSTGDSGKYKDEFKKLTKLLRAEGYQVIENHQPLTQQALEHISVLVISHPHKNKPFMESEQAAVAEFVNNGGSLMLASKSNNSTDPTMNNPLLERLGSVIQFNDDGVYDGSEDGNFWSNPASSLWSVRAHPEPVASYVTDFVRRVDYYSGASLMRLGQQPLADSDLVTIIARGNATSYQFNLAPKGTAYDTSGEQGGTAIPLIASQEIGAGRIVVAGMNVFNDRQLDDTGEKNDNVRLAANLFNWLAHRGTKVVPIGDARTQLEGTDIVVEGTVTTAAGVFFDAFYVQDGTGGIMAFNEVPKDSLQLGDTVRIYGHVKVFEQNVEIMFDNFNKNVLKLNKVPGQPLEPKRITTGAAKEEANQGVLVKLSGVVKRVSSIPDHTIYVDDGTGEALIFVDGYIAEQSGQPPVLKPGDTLEAVGVTGKFSGGYWVRVRDTLELIKGKSEPDQPDGPGGDRPGERPDSGSGSSGSSSQGNGTSGSKVAEPLPKPAHQYIVAEKDITGASAHGNRIALTMPDDITEIIMPLDTGDMLASKSLELSSKWWTARFPAEALQALSGMVAKDERADSHLSWRVNPLPDWLSLENAKSATSGLTLSGSAYQLQLMIVKKNGDSVPVEKLVQPISVTWKLDGKPNPHLVGIYAIRNDGTLEYHGGSAGNGEITGAFDKLGKYAVLEYNKRYTDVSPAHWAHSIIQEMTAKQMLQGTGLTTFEPNRPVTRAEFAALLVKAFHLGKSGKVEFADVPASKWYAEPIAVAVQAGIATGKADNRFAPDEAISRQEMAAMLVRAYEAAAGMQAPRSGALTFRDQLDISPWATEYVTAAHALGLIQGRAESRFAPTGNTTRAEAAQAIANGLKLN